MRAFLVIERESPLRSVGRARKNLAKLVPVERVLLPRAPVVVHFIVMAQSVLRKACAMRHKRVAQRPKGAQMSQKYRRFHANEQPSTLLALAKRKTSIRATDEALKDPRAFFLNSRA